MSFPVYRGSSTWRNRRRLKKWLNDLCARLTAPELLGFVSGTAWPWMFDREPPLSPLGLARLRDNTITVRE